MIPRRFRYIAPEGLHEALAVLAENPHDTTILAGGTWVVPEMNNGLRQPRTVLDLRRTKLTKIALNGTTVSVGAMTTYADLEGSELLQEHGRLLCAMAAGVTGGRQLTQQGTLGGSIVAARPQSDAPATLVALSARAIILGPGGERRHPVGDLFAAANTTSLGAGEILTGFEFESTKGLRHGYFKLKRGGSSWPIAAAAVIAAIDATGACSSLSLALGGVASTPVHADVTQRICGRIATAELVAGAAAHAGAAITEPWEDVLAPGTYRAAVASPVARRALTQALLSDRRCA